MSENLYNILGINEKATKDEIKKAYRGLQMKWHPDKNPGNQEAINMTQKLNLAYETLGDVQKREEYDNIRNNPNPFTRMNMNSHEGVGVDDILNMLFSGGGPFGGGGVPFGGGGGVPFGGGGGGPFGSKVHIFNGVPQNFQQAISKPIPIMITINITIGQVLSGSSIPVEIERWIIESGIKVYEKETIYITIPQGIDENEMIILRDKGHILNDNVKGDVKIIVKINNDSEFKRSGLDLVLEKKITLKESLCGFTFEINYINGKSYTLNNNKGNLIHPEYKKIYPEMGLSRGDHKGNMIIHFHVIFPDKLSEEQILKLSEIL
jgi:DnaJ-class molecular chaperone